MGWHCKVKPRESTRERRKRRMIQEKVDIFFGKAPPKPKGDKDGR